MSRNYCDAVRYLNEVGSHCSGIARHVEVIGTLGCACTSKLLSDAVIGVGWSATKLIVSVWSDSHLNTSVINCAWHTCYNTASSGLSNVGDGISLCKRRSNGHIACRHCEGVGSIMVVGNLYTWINSDASSSITVVGSYSNSNLFALISFGCTSSTTASHLGIGDGVVLLLLYHLLVELNSSLCSGVASKYCTTAVAHYLALTVAKVGNDSIVFV